MPPCVPSNLPASAKYTKSVEQIKNYIPARPADRNVHPGPNTSPLFDMSRPPEWGTPRLETDPRRPAPIYKKKTSRLVT